MFLESCSGCLDPYKALKEESNRSCLEAFQTIEDVISATPPEEILLLACKLAIIGNQFEFFLAEHQEAIRKRGLRGILEDFFIHESDFSHFERLISKRANLLYLTDNAGEIVFDKFLISVMKRHNTRIKITVAVKPGPILNDATVADAEFVRMAEICDNLTTITKRSVGLILPNETEEFQQVWENSDLILAKGMGYFESFHGNDDWFHCPLVHLFRVKCSTVAAVLEVPLGANILKVKYLERKNRNQDKNDN